MTRLEVTHAILDALERQGISYYRVNHVPHDQILSLRPPADVGGLFFVARKISLTL